MPDPQRLEAITQAVLSFVNTRDLRQSQQLIAAHDAEATRLLEERHALLRRYNSSMTRNITHA